MTQEVYTLMTACVSGKAKDDFVFTARTATMSKISGVVRTGCSRMLECPTNWFMTPAGQQYATLNVPASRGLFAMKISGHRTESVYSRYALVSEADLLEAAKKIESAKRVWQRMGRVSTKSTKAGHSRTSHKLQELLQIE
jgi:hypothetical protein